MTLLKTPHARAVASALFVTFLWSGSWVLIKFGLRGNIQPLLFAGLRYTIAAMALLPMFFFSPRLRGELNGLPAKSFRLLILLGVIYYFVTQGCQFIALKYMPAATLTLMLNATPFIVALSSYFFVREKLTKIQTAGMVFTFTGLLLYFSPTEAMNILSGIGFIAGVVQVFSNAGSALLGRTVNKSLGLSPLTVTFISMSIGAILLLISGLYLYGLPEVTPMGWLIIIWLGVVHTALAFTLWNKSLQVLTAVESVIINNTMLPQIVIMAWVFLGETVGIHQIIGLCIVGVGAYLVQRKK